MKLIFDPFSFMGVKLLYAQGKRVLGGDRVTNANKADIKSIFKYLYLRSRGKDRA